jgi:succinyl-diaminopimelate desuccinylase
VTDNASAGPGREAIERSTLELARDLVARPSVTPSDGGCTELLSTRLAAAGFRVDRLDRCGVANLWARRGTTRPLVCFAGHVDVVPPGPIDRWANDPFEPTERDGFLYGRGVSDMKGPLAAMVTAAERFVAARPVHSGSIAFLVTSDEEGSATDGTIAVVEALRAAGETIDACVLGEPTSSAKLGDTMKNGRRGSLNGRLLVRGVQCHIAYPELGRNPIHQALPALGELAGIEWDKGSEHFGPTSFQISNVRAGTGAVNVIPDSLDVAFNFRYSPAWTDEGLRGRVRDVLDRHGLDYELEWQLAGAPFLTEPGPLVQAVSAAIEAVTGVTPALSTSGGTSDGRFLAGISRELIEFGPLNDTIHKVNERLAIADCGPLSEIYEQILARLLR